MTRVYSHFVTPKSQQIESKDRFPLLVYCLGLSLFRHTRLNNRIPHYQGETISPFHQSIKDTIRENRDSIGNQNPYQDILPTETEPLYHRMKGMYMYTILDTEEAFRNLHNPEYDNRTKEVTYRHHADQRDQPRMPILQEENKSSTCTQRVRHGKPAGDTSLTKSRQ